MGLATAERGLELDDRLAALAGDSPERLDHQPAHAFGEIGASEELDRVLVLGVGPAAHHLGEVRRELGLPIAARRHVGMRSRHFPPRPQLCAGRSRKHAGGCTLPGVGAARGFKPGYRCRRPFRAVAHGSRQFPKALRRVRVDLLDEPGHGVERSPRVLVGRIDEPRVRPLVPRRNQLLEPGTMVAAELAPEELVPLEVHQPEAAGCVEPRDQLLVLALGREIAPLALEEHVEDPSSPPILRELRAQLPRDIGRKNRIERLHPLGDALVVGGHRLLPSIRRTDSLRG